MKRWDQSQALSQAFHPPISWTGTSPKCTSDLKETARERSAGKRRQRHYKYGPTSVAFINYLALMPACAVLLYEAPSRGRWLWSCDRERSDRASWKARLLRAARTLVMRHNAGVARFRHPGSLRETNGIRPGR